MSDEYTPTQLDVLVACETLLRAGYTAEALGALMSSTKLSDKLQADIRSMLVKQ